MTDAEHDKRIAEETRLLYSTSVAEIAGFKQQQWHITNYALLLNAAILSLLRIVDPVPSRIEHAVLEVLAIAILVAGWKLVGMFSESIQVRRLRLTHIRKICLTEEFRTSWRGGASESEMPDLPEEKVNLLILFRAVLAIGFAATTWILIRSALAV